ncbi:hypothetical protein HHI36_010716 [Cryptolaemus montrouzieri]|uniref:Mitochondrial ribosomal protein S28 n=1 Tax=Cryptolaemus montrouzieri TaxID=559131 RepID=A0ABD2MJK7_9CUCU
MLRNIYTYFSHTKLFKSQYKRFLSETVVSNTTEKQSGFAKSYEKFDDLNKETPQPSVTFENLLRNSRFIDMGDPEKKVVIGKIFHVVGDDLYIDFGWKFHCVCPRPKKNASEYMRGAKVRLAIKELELSSKFLGYEKDLTLLEADCTLLGLVQDRGRKVA